ncbi:MAG TPA: biopolymer transporter ExbD [Marinilabiliaceae bacterium]|nr:biopolymer transporter ExbD [Marinilabiliaceae bacterium]HBX88284.1 biopolymer transporter ExbD [Marinilabiliaceae bacterium]
MALKRRNIVNPSFSMSSMTDIVFLLLIFFMITSTLVSPNAIKLMLPQSTQQTSAKAVTSVSITQNLNYYIESRRVSFNQLEAALQERIGDKTDVYISLHVDENVPMKEVVKVMNIAKNNDYKVILATRAR